jgi:hypothetical protein
LGATSPTVSAVPSAAFLFFFADLSDIIYLVVVEIDDKNNNDLQIRNE